MAYRQIIWIKLEKRLLNDPRFFTMSREAQLFYIKLILMCAEYTNKVPRSISVLRQILRTDQDDSAIEELIKEVKEHFPKVLSHRDYYYIKGFKEMHNWYLPSNSSATPQQVQDKIRIRKDTIQGIISEYIKLKGWDPPDKEMLNYIYKRWGKAAKKLALIAKEKDIEALKWLGNLLNEKNLEWTLETVISWLPKYLKEKNKTEFERKWIK